MRRPPGGVWAVAGGASLAVLLGATGCEQMPWSSQPKGMEQATAASAPSPGAVTPPRPILPSTEVLASVNGATISTRDVEMRVQELKVLTESLGQPWEPLPVEALEGELSLRAVLDDLIDTELISQDGVARGLDRSLDVQRRWQSTRRSFYAQEWLRWARGQHAVSPEEVEAYYTANRLGFQEFERLRLRQLTLASEDQAKRALAQLHGGAVEFAALAQQISVGPTARDGGLLAEWAMRANEAVIEYGSLQDAQADGIITLDPSLEAAALAIGDAGQISNYVKGPDERYHIFQLVERRPARQRPIADVWDQIQAFLVAQKLQEAVEGLAKQATIERFTDRLGEVVQE